MSSPVELSVVIPIYNEVECLPELHRQLTAALEPLGRAYEIILVDDGSSDGSREQLRAIAADDPHVLALLFRRNLGQTPAMQAGFDHARGEVVLALDGDLQNDPADFPRLLARLDEGYDIVSGWRVDRADDEVRKLPSRIANRLLQSISGQDLHDTGCCLKAYRREVLRHVRLYGQLHRFIPALASACGARVTEIPVQHHPRTLGTSKYGIGRTTKVICDMVLLKFILAYWNRPIHAFGKWALCAGGVALFAVLVGLLGGGSAWLLAALILLGTGANLLGLGVLAEVLMRTYHEAGGRPTYLIDEVVQSEEAA
ncbi:MAG: glycosyltransferase family 2 protein [Armatimonadetes bacterium]|nr:glycosyltransferase family 2 protein [Armatimonadota bacterium]